MFNQLIEAKAKKQKMAGGTVFSVVLHTFLIAGAVYATARAGVKDEKAKAEKIQFVEMKKEPPKEPPKETPPKEVIVKPPIGPHELIVVGGTAGWGCTSRHPPKVNAITASRRTVVGCFFIL